MFQPKPYPESMSKPCKLSVFENQATELGLHDRFYRPPLTTSFEDGVNNAGVLMCRSTCSGNESTGINDGSKKSVLVTYLADAWTWGAEIFCGVDVRHIRALGNKRGYVVFYELSDGWQGNKRLMWVCAVGSQQRKLVCDTALTCLTEGACDLGSRYIGYH